MAPQGAVVGTYRASALLYAGGVTSVAGAPTVPAAAVGASNPTAVGDLRVVVPGVGARQARPALNKVEGGGDVARAVWAPASPGLVAGTLPAKALLCRCRSGAGTTEGGTLPVCRRESTTKVPTSISRRFRVSSGVAVSPVPEE